MHVLRQAKVPWGLRQANVRGTLLQTILGAGARKILPEGRGSK